MEPKSEKSSVQRKIFLNLLISYFLISSYFIISEIFGSISTHFLGISEFTLEFGVTLFVFTFFAILAGSVHGLIAGFLGEFIYQLAYYDEIYIYWCVIIAILGFLVGIYKYKPLKYHKGINAYYTFIILIIASFITMSLILLFQHLYNYNNLDTETILLNYAIKFLIQAIASLIFFIPILLILYDKGLASKERHIYSELLTHHSKAESDHTIVLTFGRTHIYFCTRCSGFVIGAIFSMFIIRLISLIYTITVSAEFAILSCIILPIPGLFDWGTQKLGYRKSTTETRLLTGFIIGVALHLISYTKDYYIFLLFLIIFYFTIFFLLMYFGNKREIKKYRSQIQKLKAEIELEDFDD